jgi:predicted dehydrogenase
MRMLIIGCGSIGKRHSRILAQLGHEVICYDLHKEESFSLSEELKGKGAITGTVKTMEEGMEKKPDAAFICTPPNAHMAQVMSCIQKGIPVFIEKPVAESMKELRQAIDLAKNKSALTMVACNLRFTEGLQRVKHLLENGRLGKIVSAHVEFGYDLRKWRPTQDYRKRGNSSRCNT